VLASELGKQNSETDGQEGWIGARERDGVAEGKTGDRRVGTPYDLLPTAFIGHVLSSYKLKQC
jgi:hypothetical protein